MSNYNNELHKHKAADTIKWIVAFVLIIAIMGAVVCLALQVGGVFDFFKKDDKPAEDVGVEDSLKDAFVLNPVSTKYVKLLAAAAPGTTYDEDMQVHLTATLQPENVDDKRVDWTIAFANPASEWATGKTVTEYVTVTPTADGSLEADVKGLKAFGEQIVITCTARSNSEAKATCTVDCIAKYALKNTITAVGDGSSDATVTVSLTKTDGTIDATNTLSYKFAMTSNVHTYYIRDFNSHSLSFSLDNPLSSASDLAVSGLTHQIKLPYVKSDLTVFGVYDTANKENFYKKFLKATTVPTLLTNPTLVNRVNAFIRQFLNDIKTRADNLKSVFSLELTLTSKNDVYGYSNTSTVEIGIEPINMQRYNQIIMSIIDAVSSVELSQNGIVF